MAGSATNSLIFFSGLAADARVFGPQQLAFPGLVVPDWPRPQQNETLTAYCKRLAVDLPVDGHLILGGASFGGIVALHVAQFVQPQAVILIGSLRSPVELPPVVRYGHFLKRFLPLVPVGFLQWCIAPLVSKLAQRRVPYWWGLASQFRQSDPTVFKWSLARILDWTAAPKVVCPIFQIHGSRDGVLPLRFTQPDAIVSGGGHVISLTHSKEVNDFIGEVLVQLTDESTSVL